MVGIKGMHKFGRPKTPEGDRAKYRMHSFYYPLRIEDVWQEFDKLSKKRFSGFNYPSRSKSMMIRNLIFDFVIKNSTDKNIKDKIKNFLEEENKYVKKHTRPITEEQKIKQ